MKTVKAVGASAKPTVWLVLVLLLSATAAPAQPRPTNTRRPTITPRRSATPDPNQPTPTDTAIETPTDTPEAQPTDTPAEIATDTPDETGVTRTATRTLRLRTRTATPGGDTPTAEMESPTIAGETTPTPTRPTAASPTSLPVTPRSPTQAASPTPTPTATRNARVGSPIAFRAAGHFDISKPPAVPAIPVVLALGNFNPNDDLDVDVIIADAATDTIRWGQNNGRGTFQSRAPVLVGPGPAGLGVADFNGDGVLDVAVANSGDGSISIVINKGDGKFQPAATTAIGGDLRGMVAIGNLLVVADASASQVVLATVSGSAVSAAGTVAVGQGPVAVVEGDINGDGTTDVAVANRAGNSVSILLATGPTTFNVVATLPTGSGPSALALGDLDKDGDLDLVVAQSDENTVSVWGNDGRGGFTLATTLATGVNPSAVGIIDDVTVHGVGEPNADFFVANAGSNDVSLFGGRGNLSFLLSSRVIAGRIPLSMVVGQFDNDSESNADVAVASSGDGAIGVLRGQGNGSFVAVPNYSANLMPRAITAGDFDSDGENDIVAANQGSGDVSFLKGNGKAALNPRGTVTNTAVGDSPIKLASGDFDADGRRDLAVVLANGELRLVRGNGDGTFAPPRVIDTAAVDVIARDLNLDGFVDLIATRSNDNAATVYLGGIGGLFNEQNIGLAASGQNMALDDIDGDNVPELFVAEAGASAVEIFGGALPFRSAGRIDVGDTPDSVAAADFDQDGFVDVAVLSTNSNRVLVFRGVPGGYAGGVALAVDPGSTKIVAADLNGDPYPDLTVMSAGTDTIVAHPSDGQGGFDPPTRVLVGRGPTDIVAVDLNNNILPDVVVVNADGETVSVLRNVTLANPVAMTPTPTAGRGTPTAPPPPTPPPTPGRQPGGGGGNGGGSDSSSGSSGCAMQPSVMDSGLWLYGLALLLLRRRVLRG